MSSSTTQEIKSGSKQQNGAEKQDENISFFEIEINKKIRNAKKKIR